MDDPNEIPAGTEIETNAGPPRSYAPYVDHNNDADNAMENLQDVAGRFYAEARAGFQKLPERVEAWDSLSEKMGHAKREIRSAAEGMKAAAVDPFLPEDGRRARVQELQKKGQTLLDSWTNEAPALLQIAEAELKVRALPKMSEGRESHAREEVRTILDGIPASDQLGEMIQMAQGKNRDHAAVIISGLGQAILRRALPDERERATWTEALTNAAITGTVAHGTDEQKAYAKALREALPAAGKHAQTELAYIRHQFTKAQSGR